MLINWNWTSELSYGEGLWFLGATVGPPKASVSPSPATYDFTTIDEINQIIVIVG